MPAKSPPIARSVDFEFSWVTRELGERWEPWRALAAQWLATKRRSTSDRVFTMRAFLEGYLHKQDLPVDPAWFFSRANAVPDFYQTACPQTAKGVIYSRYAHEFAQWVLESQFSEPDDHGRPVIFSMYHNPIAVRSYGEVHRPTESVRSPLPYRFIRELREVLAPGKHFRDWTWAQERHSSKRGAAVNCGDWFAVDPSAVDDADPDCVTRQVRSATGETVTQMWSPVRAVALWVKLTLPLRTHQTLMLDSGEADTWRYETKTWVLNSRPLAQGTSRKPLRRGVFRRVEDYETSDVRTALYINTNKTADVRRDEDQLGYVIPWQHEELLYWLEKLRNWQEKYNPIAAPASWTQLEIRHLKTAKSRQELERRPPTCFLFRHAAGTGAARSLPLPATSPERMWYALLAELERRCAQRGDVLADGRPLQFVVPTMRDGGCITLFPLHSLRVSLRGRSPRLPSVAPWRQESCRLVGPPHRHLPGGRQCIGR